MNSSLGDSEALHERVAIVLGELEKMSAEINSSWSEENRLHFQIVDFPPAIVLKMGFRDRETFSVFAIPARADSAQQKGSWQEVGLDLSGVDNRSVSRSLELYPLYRSASGNARFLAKFIVSGCAGPVSVQYDAQEWDPESGVAGLGQIIKLEGAFGLEGNVPGFPQVGDLRTRGPLVTLPYCWFSAIDTWDNPSLCAVDTFDLSKDTVRFGGSVYNRPDLVPVAKTIEYARRYDYSAVLGYCASADIATHLVRDMTPNLFADDLRVTRLAAHRERVELGYPISYRFEVEKRHGRWLVVAFNESPN
jgi:hypothetical protein